MSDSSYESMMYGWQERAWAAEKERDQLREAIKTHRAQKADDRCIEDDDRLYEALGDGIKCDRRVGDKLAMFHNCIRFIERRCESGGWPSYKELESQLAKAMEALVPFANMGKDNLLGDPCPLGYEPERLADPGEATIGDCRRAAKLIDKYLGPK